MAKNWGMGEAYQVLREGKDYESIEDINRRHPLFAYFVLTAQDFDIFVNALNDRVNARAIESDLRKYLDVIEKNGEQEEKVNEKKSEEGLEKKSKKKPKKKSKKEKPAKEESKKKSKKEKPKSTEKKEEDDELEFDLDDLIE